MHFMGSALVYAAKQPNVILILADDVGYEALGCYGGKSYPTLMDALAKGGLRRCTGTACRFVYPTRVAVLTGRYPINVSSPKWGTFPASWKNKL